MFDEKRFKERIRSEIHQTPDDLESDIDMLATKDLWKELEELEEMMSVAG